MTKKISSILAEGRCQGIGKDYVPFYLAEEARSRGTASRIYDPIEGRFIHTMSKTESLFYYHLRGDPDVRHIREQYLLRDELMQEIKKSLGIHDSGKNYTTDFLVDYNDGSQRAFCVKFTNDLFTEDSPRYAGRHNAYVKLCNRVTLERTYWEALGVEFFIITREMLNRTFAANICSLLRAWTPDDDPSLDMKTLYLIAHGYIDADLVS